jgi:dGTPase
MKDHGGFDHNLQSLRIVEKLEKRFPDFDGLNLSWEVREGIMKHETEYDCPATTSDEPCRRGTLECQIVNAADEVAYITSDLDDGLRSGLLLPRQLREVTLWGEIVETLDIDVTTGLSELDRHRIIRRMIGREVTDLITATDRRLQDFHSPDDVRALPENVVAHSLAMQRHNREMKDFLYHNLYRHWRVMRMASKAQRLLSRLFRLYLAEPWLLPEQVQERMMRARHSQDAGETPERIVCDYLAGMTDRFAQQEYQKLFDPLERV